MKVDGGLSSQYSPARQKMIQHSVDVVETSDLQIARHCSERRGFAMADFSLLQLHMAHTKPPHTNLMYEC